MQGGSVGAFWEIELEIAVLAILTDKVVVGTAVVLLARQLWIVGYAILQAAAYCGIDIYQPVGLCHNESVDASWSMVGGGTMVLCGLGYSLYLLGSEPLAELLVFSHDASRNEVVTLASLTESEIMVSCCHHDECGICLGVMLSHLCTALHDALYVVKPMGCIEVSIAGEDMLMEVIL